MTKFEIISNKQVQAPTEQQFVVTESFLKHIENDQCKLRFGNADENYANFSFEYEENGNFWNIPFEMEVVYETIAIEFEGGHLPESIRMVASKLLEEVIYATRFLHKDKYWSLSNFYIKDVATYKQRVQAAFLEQMDAVWSKIAQMAKVEKMDIEDYYFFEAEGIDDVSLWMTGEDAHMLLNYLEEKNIIRAFRKRNENLYEVELFIQKDPIQTINAKLIFERELSELGYNIWTDYVD